MTNTMTRSLIETLVRSKLKALKDSPERTTRNLIDMALQFSNGRFQKRFFEIAQEMLRNEKSNYYSLTHQAVSNIDTERLLNFGMNVGYNSFTYGAEKIRSMESYLNFNIPWCITLELDDKLSDKKFDHYCKILQDGKSLGIYTWNIFLNGELSNFLPIIEMNKDCAFLLFCKASEIDAKTLESLTPLTNIMFVIEYHVQHEEIFKILKELGFLYSAYYVYASNDADDIINGEILCSTEATGSVFSIFIPDGTCSKETQMNVYRYILNSRNILTYNTIPFDFLYDNQRIDSILSDDSCAACFDSRGMLQPTPDREYNFDKLNLFEHSLFEIFKIAFPKSTSNI